MSENMYCFPLLSALFFVTTVLLSVFCVILVRRINRLRSKIVSFREKIEAKNKEVNKKNNPLKLLKPYESESAKSIIISVNTQNEMTYMNDYAEEFFGYSKEELLGKDIFDTIYTKKNSKESGQENVIAQILAHPKMYVETEIEVKRKNGIKAWVSWTNRVMYDADGQPSEIRSVGFDITKRKQLEYELRSLSVYDSLTGVYNRQAFLEFGVKELKRANRYNRQLSLLIMRLDFFQTLDSSREFSDEILKDIIDVCANSIRESDIIGRLNDIEFGIILPETPIENASFLAEQLKLKIQERNLSNKNDFFVNAVFGVAEKTKKDLTIDSLISKAFETLEKSEKSNADKNNRKGVKK